MNEVRYGVIGFGHQGGYYADIIKRSGDNYSSRVTAICDSNPSKRLEAKKLYPEVEIFDDYKSLIDSGLVDAILIETPHYFHPEIAIYAFKHHTHVLSDKPAGVYCKNVIEELEESKKHPELLFGTFFNQRTNPLYIKAKELINSDDFGQMTRLNWIITDWYRTQAYYDNGAWRGTFKGEGGGVLLNQCPHQIDLLAYFCGLPKKVTATIKTVGRNITVENDVTAILEYDNMVATFITSTHDAPGTNRLEFTGTGGKIVIEDNTIKFYKNSIKEDVFAVENKEFMSKPEVEEIIYSADEEDTEEMRKLKINFGSAQPQHLLIIKRFSDVLLGKEKTLYATGEDGLNELILSNAMHLSGWLNKTVTLPLDHDLFLKLLKERIEQEEK